MGLFDLFVTCVFTSDTYELDHMFQLLTQLINIDVKQCSCTLPNTTGHFEN